MSYYIGDSDAFILTQMLLTKEFLGQDKKMPGTKKRGILTTPFEAETSLILLQKSQPLIFLSLIFGFLYLTRQN